MKRRNRHKLTRAELDHIKVAVTSSAIAFVVEVDEVMGRRRFEQIVMARLTAYWILRNVSQMTLMRIGDGFERDHGAISSGLKKIQGIIDTRCDDHKHYTKIKKSVKDFSEMITDYKVEAITRKRKELEDALRVV